MRFKNTKKLNPNRSPNPLGTLFYHLGTAGNILTNNSFVSYKGTTIKRKLKPQEIRDIHIKRAAALHVFGQKISNDPTDVKLMCDVLYRAWTSKLVGTAFCLRTLNYIVDTEKAFGNSTRYCRNMINSLIRHCKLKGYSLTLNQV